MVWCFARAGASPNRRDHGRRLCAEEWARFCGRHACADAVQKYIRSTKYFFAKTFLLARDKWKSEPDLLQLQEPAAGSPTVTTAGEEQAEVDCITESPSITSSTSAIISTARRAKDDRRDSGGWIQRHLSLTDANGGKTVQQWFQRHLSLKRKKHQPQVSDVDVCGLACVWAGASRFGE